MNNGVRLRLDSYRYIKTTMNLYAFQMSLVPELKI